MPVDAGGNVARPASPRPVSGQDADAPQVNVPIDDIYAALNMLVFLDGRKSLTGHLPMNGYRITNLGTPSASTDAATKAYADSVMPIGTVVDFAGSTAPTGWLMCYGQAVSRSTYAALFSALGTTYGSGDGATTFNLPDCRGRVVAGKDDMGGTSANRLTNQSGGLNGDTLGATGGHETNTLDIANIPNHSHSAFVNDPGHSHTVLGWTTSVGGIEGGAGVGYYQAIATSTSGTGISVSIGATGTGGAHNNVQPTIIMNKIIKAL